MQDFACHGNQAFPWVDPETSYRIFNVPEAPVKAFANKEQRYGRPNAVNQTRNVFRWAVSVAFCEVVIGQSFVLLMSSVITEKQQYMSMPG